MRFVKDSVKLASALCGAVQVARSELGQKQAMDDADYREYLASLPQSTAAINNARRLMDRDYDPDDEGDAMAALQRPDRFEAD